MQRGGFTVFLFQGRGGRTNVQVAGGPQGQGAASFQLDAGSTLHGQVAAQEVRRHRADLAGGLQAHIHWLAVFGALVEVGNGVDHLAAHHPTARLIGLGGELPGLQHWLQRHVSLDHHMTCRLHVKLAEAALAEEIAAQRKACRRGCTGRDHGQVGGLQGQGAAALEIKALQHGVLDVQRLGGHGRRFGGFVIGAGFERDAACPAQCVSCHQRHMGAGRHIDGAARGIEVALSVQRHRAALGHDPVIAIAKPGAVVGEQATGVQAAACCQGERAACECLTHQLQVCVQLDVAAMRLETACQQQLMCGHAQAATGQQGQVVGSALGNAGGCQAEVPGTPCGQGAGGHICSAQAHVAGRCGVGSQLGQNIGLWRAGGRQVDAAEFEVRNSLSPRSDQEHAAKGHAGMAVGAGFRVDLQVALVSAPHHIGLHAAFKAHGASAEERRAALVAFGVTRHHLAVCGCDQFVIHVIRLGFVHKQRFLLALAQQARGADVRFADLDAAALHVQGGTGVHHQQALAVEHQGATVAAQFLGGSAQRGLRSLDIGHRDVGTATQVKQSALSIQRAGALQWHVGKFNAEQAHVALVAVAVDCNTPQATHVEGGTSLHQQAAAVIGGVEQARVHRGVQCKAGGTHPANGAAHTGPHLAGRQQADVAAWRAQGRARLHLHQFAFGPDARAAEGFGVDLRGGAVVGRDLGEAAIAQHHRAQVLSQPDGAHVLVSLDAALLCNGAAHGHRR